MFPVLFLRFHKKGTQWDTRRITSVGIVTFGRHEV